MYTEKVPRNPDTAFGQLLKISPSPDYSLIDTTIAIDVLSRRLDILDLVNSYYIDGSTLEYDFMPTGESRASWIYRLGGIKAILNTLDILPIEHSARAAIIGFARYIAPGEEWIRRLSQNEIEARSVLEVLQAAMDRNDDIAVEMIKERFDIIAANTTPQQRAELYRIIQHFELYEFKKHLTEKSVAINPQFIPPTNEDNISRQRFLDIQESVIDAVNRKDIDLLYRYQKLFFDEVFGTESRYYGNYHYGEQQIIEMGIDILENNAASIIRKPSYMITDILEARLAFERAAAQYTIQKEFIPLEDENKKITVSVEIRNRDPYTDPAFWFTVRLGELRDIETLRNIVYHPTSSLEVKKEAVRWLAIYGEETFLRKFTKVNPVDIKFWKTIIQEVLPQTDYSISFKEKQQKDIDEYQAKKNMLSRIKNDLNTYICTVIGVKI